MAFFPLSSDMSSKRKNIPMKLSPTMPKSADDGSFQPEFSKDNDQPLEVEVNHKRSSSVDSDKDSAAGSPVSKKMRILSSMARDEVLDSVKRAVLTSNGSVSEKQQQLSQMIAELQSLQQNLAGTSNGVRSLVTQPIHPLPPRPVPPRPLPSQYCSKVAVGSESTLWPSQQLPCYHFYCSSIAWLSLVCKQGFVAIPLPLFHYEFGGPQLRQFT